ncbi:MAG TPA: diphosphomevalonate decarboxylase [Myxococcaceae bacterium]|nr:diphosphomevalonate decarboxylase [Myxococcaceae bacterium]
MTASRKATAVAHPNIALVKYWGKRDEALILPHQSSLSLTIAPLAVRTTVQLGVAADEVVINGRPAQGSERARVLDLIAKVFLEVPTVSGPVKVVSKGDFPQSAGLASSAAAFAALAVAVRAAAGLIHDSKASSLLARQGSGSASRSVDGGFTVWRRGTDPSGSDSFAEPVFAETHWPEFRMAVAVVDRGEKTVKSRDGMRLTQETSPYYPAWVSSTEKEIEPAVELIRRRDLKGLGALTERNAWRMHASAMAADPAVCYLKPKTLEIIQRVAAAREHGLPAWFTLDAGPNPVIFTDSEHLDAVERLLRECGALEVTRCIPGAGTALSNEHLF